MFKLMLQLRRMSLPRFKWIGFTGQVLRHPDWSDRRLADDLRQQIDRALELGYAVLVAEGLQPGQEVVGAGVHVLTPGQKVRRYIEPARAASR